MEGGQKVAGQKPRRISLGRRIVFSLLLSLALLLALDQALALMDWPEVPSHQGVNLEAKELLCYSSDQSARFPMDLTSSPADLALARQIVKSPEALENLRNKTPHCVPRDLIKTDQGMHPERPRKLLLTGDSFAQGFGLPLANTMGPRLEEQLPGVSVRNHGIAGQNVSDVEALQKQLLAEETQPQETIPQVEGILYFYNLNDIVGTPVLGPPNDEFHKWQGTQSDLVRMISTVSGLCRAVQIYRLQRETTQDTIKVLRHQYLGAGSKKRMTATIETMARMAAQAKRRGMAFVVVIWPMMYQDLSGAYPLKDLHALLLARCKTAGLTCVDGLPAFAEHDMADLQVHPADAHPNEVAVRLLADFLIKGKHLPLREGS